MKFDPEEDDTIQYSTDADAIPSVVRSLGSIHASSTFASLSYAVGDGISTARVKVEANFQVITKDRHGNRKEGGDRLNVVINQPDGDVLKSKVKDEGKKDSTEALQGVNCTTSFKKMLSLVWLYCSELAICKQKTKQKIHLCYIKPLHPNAAFPHHLMPGVHT